MINYICDLWNTNRRPNLGAFICENYYAWAKQIPDLNLVLLSSFSAEWLRNEHFVNVPATAEIRTLLYLPSSAPGLGDLLRKLDYSYLSNVSLGAKDSEVNYISFFSAYIKLRISRRSNNSIIEFQESNIDKYIKSLGLEKFVQSINNSKGVVCVGKHLVERLDNLGVKIPMLYAPNSVDLKKFRPFDKQECRNILGINQESKILIFVGHFIKRKNPGYVLKLLEKNPQWKCIMIGSGSIDVKHPRVIFNGLVKHDQLPYYYNAADVYVLPSFNEGLANTTVEALSCGLPLIVSDKDFNKNFLSDKNAIFVDPDTEPTLLLDELFEGFNVMKQANTALRIEFGIDKRISNISSFKQSLNI